jgi:hypothetical protein
LRRQRDFEVRIVLLVDQWSRDAIVQHELRLKPNDFRPPKLAFAKSNCDADIIAAPAAHLQCCCDALVHISMATCCLVGLPSFLSQTTSLRDNNKTHEFS